MPSLGMLIEEVEATSPSSEPLDLLTTASATAREVDDVTDSMLSHFVDRCRRAGHSWAEIGTALGVTKQAVQKRFTGPDAEPVGLDRYTARARRLVGVHAPAASAELGHGWIGTEHLLLGFFADPEALAPVVLVGLGLDRDAVIDAIDARLERGHATERTFTPRAWAAIQSCAREAVVLGHNYVGTEHQLLALLSGVGGIAADILTDADITHERVVAEVVERLAGFVPAGGAPPQR